MAKNFRLKIGDILLMSFILIASVLLLIMPFFSKKAEIAEISVAGTGELLSISLDKDQNFEVSSQGIHLTVCVRDGAVFVSDSDCRDGICRGTRPISRAGQSIVCLPAGVVIRIVGEGATVDGVSG